MNRFSLSLMALLFVACTDSAGELSGDRDKADQLSEDEIPQVAGIYGYVLQSSVVSCKTKTDAEDCKDDERSNGSLSVHGLVHLTQDGAIVEGSFQACRIQFTDDEGETESDRDYLNSSSTLRGLGEIAQFSGNFIASEDGPVLDTGVLGFVLGAELSDPVGEDMPTDEDDARALDHDNDGEPGITVDAPLGKIYMGVRAIVDMQLTVTAEDGSIGGTMNAHDMDISVYDDTVPFVNVSKKLKKALRTSRVVSQEHHMQMVPGLADCDEVLASLL